jgi:hypothetical protein
MAFNFVEETETVVYSTARDFAEGLALGITIASLFFC